MTDVYVVRNQLGQFWGKSKAWADGRDPKAIMRSAHEDEAVNTLFELSSKDFELRGEVVQVELSEKREPIVEPSEHLIEPEPTAAKTAVAAQNCEHIEQEPSEEEQQAGVTEEPQADSGEEPQAGPEKEQHAGLAEQTQAEAPEAKAASEPPTDRP